MAGPFFGGEFFGGGFFAALTPAATETPAGIRRGRKKKPPLVRVNLRDVQDRESTADFLKGKLFRNFPELAPKAADAEAEKLQQAAARKARAAERAAAKAEAEAKEAARIVAEKKAQIQRDNLTILMILAARA